MVLEQVASFAAIAIDLDVVLRVCSELEVKGICGAVEIVARGTLAQPRRPI